jgi:hypothetical protein
MIAHDQLPIYCYQCYRIEFLCMKGEGNPKTNMGGCRYWVDDFDIGNCVLRCDREHGQREIANRLGLSYQEIQHIEHKAKAKLKVRIAKEWRSGNMVSGGIEKVNKL